MPDVNQQFEQAAKLIQPANHMVAMTGAGISTISGIPDFRSPDSGLWDNVDPLAVASIHAFRQHPDRFYQWARTIAPVFLQAKPNPAHFALAKLERHGILKAIITQNIDNLHYLAGSHTVHELHGHLREVTCTGCLRVQDAADVVKKFIADGQVPRCEQCGGVLKPNAILFGEQMPMQEFVAAQMAIEAADLILIVGSSLEVAPASDLPMTGLAHGAKLIIINYQPTYLDDRADLVIRTNIAEALPKIADLVIP